MIDFDRARQVMVDNQLRTSNVTDWSVLTRMGAVPRERFVPESRKAIAYIDDIHALGQAGRFMLAPAALAKLLQLAEISRTDSVLDIGAGTGYATAVIAGLAASVIGLESDAALAATARSNLSELGLGNASIVAGDVAALGKAHFDLVLVQGALDTVPAEFLALLEDGGRLVTVVRQGGVAVANVFVKTDGTVAARAEFDLAVPALFAAPRDVAFVF